MRNTFFWNCTGTIVFLTAINSNIEVHSKCTYSLFFYSYVVPVVFLALLLNIPKFLEAKFEWTNSTINGSIEYELSYTITELRDDPNYIQFYINWTRLVTTGIIPMTALIYFNFGIFRGIQVCRKLVAFKIGNHWINFTRF